MFNQKEIERCRVEQIRCRDHLLNGGGDRYGAELGLSDWLVEELILYGKFTSNNIDISGPTGDYSLKSYREFLKRKTAISRSFGFDVEESEVNPILKPHQNVSVRWLVHGGRRAAFQAFGLGKTVIQLETLRLVIEKARAGKPGLIVAPLGVRQEFKRDAKMLGTKLSFIRSVSEVDNLDGIYLTNYETVREGKIDPSYFGVASLDEAAVLRGFGGVKTFREFMTAFEPVPYRFVATATPDPNEYIELLAYSAYLGIMDVSQAKTRFFKRDSTKADNLKIFPGREEEFWQWVASWALFLQRPSDLGPGYSDEGYDLPELEVIHHEIKAGDRIPDADRGGQYRLIRDASMGVVDAAREKRDSLDERMAMVESILAAAPKQHHILWHDLEDERDALEGMPMVASVYGKQDPEEQEQIIEDFAAGRIKNLAAKPSMFGAGVNWQKYCHIAVFCGVGFKFAAFIQAIKRIHRYLQKHKVQIHLIYTDLERGVVEKLLDKWRRHVVQVDKMSEIIREYGLSELSLAQALTRATGVSERFEIVGPAQIYGTEPIAPHNPLPSDIAYRLIHQDAVEEIHQEAARMPESSVQLILTSIPFGTMYEYSPNYSDFGHTNDPAHFWEQMDFLSPQLLRVLEPGRLCCIHVKDRIVPGGLTGLGFQTVYPFHAEAIAHYTRHGFAYMGMKTIVTDVVRENNQTYRLGWSEQCKDGSKMGVGMPEYLLIFRKPPTDSKRSYADRPVVKLKRKYSRSRWQIDAHGYMRSNGNRALTPEEIQSLPHATIFKMYQKYALESVYDFEHHVHLGEALELWSVNRGLCKCDPPEKCRHGRLPVTFMLLQPPSWHPDVWTDITRMMTLNAAQSAKGREMHLCLAEGSLVLTRERGYVPIQTVQPGEHALTHKGRWREILTVGKTGKKEVVSLHAQGVSGLTLTPDHKLWCRKSEWAREREGAERSNPEWIEARDSLGGYLNLRLPAEEGVLNNDPLHWWIVGRWLADGHWEQRGAAIISCGRHEVETLTAKLGTRAGGMYDTGNVIQIRILDPDSVLKETLRKCGTGASGKGLPPEAVTLPQFLAAELLDGFLSGDGHYRQEHDRWYVTIVNKRLALGIAFLAQRVHETVASVYPGRQERYAEIEGRTVHCKPEWVICFYPKNSERRKQPFVLPDGAWKKVRSIEVADFQETWNIHVAEDESYTAEGCIVKNCPMQFDLADRIIAQYTMEGETVLDPFGGLMTVPYRAVRLKRRAIGIELSKPYLLDGAKYCEAALRERDMPSLFDLLEDAQFPDAGEIERVTAEAAADFEEGE